eukprot:TRINITY_DN10955_c0_g1_i1.p1 TRINITY_DN10955_c0_g1~~TRINITY_DN10955_c0_g1_i1.p1  ORF type:complete len:124 (+),score=1.24 TRINITY_DN10955_c0_g1_i1:689-1060(+)
MFHFYFSINDLPLFFFFFPTPPPDPPSLLFIFLIQFIPDSVNSQKKERKGKSGCPLFRENALIGLTFFLGSRRKGDFHKIRPNLFILSFILFIFPNTGFDLSSRNPFFFLFFFLSSFFLAINR